MIQTHPHGAGFIDTATGRRFVPVGTNYAAVLRAPGLEPAGTLLAMKEHGKIGTLHLSHVHVEGLETLVANEERVARTLSHQVETGARP